MTMSVNEPTELVEACREELECLWHDLDKARRDAINGAWSVDCESKQERIKRLTLLVGATSWESVPITLLELGLYQRIHGEIGIDAPVDMDRVAETRRRIEERHAMVLADRRRR